MRLEFAQLGGHVHNHVQIGVERFDLIESSRVQLLEHLTLHLRQLLGLQLQHARLGGYVNVCTAIWKAAVEAKVS